MKKTILTFFLLACCGTAAAHFGVLMPNKSIVENQKDATVSLTASFQHPMEQARMTMAKPKSLGVVAGENKTQFLTDQLKQIKEKDEWVTDFKITRPGLYQFFLEPEPYWEPAEDKFIIHYSKVAVPAFGEEEGWDKPVGLPVEIVPLTRPFGNYAGNIFTGQVLVKGKPAANTEVEVEYMNDKGKYQAPNDTFITQVVKTDSNGIFHYVAPWAGWWGFAALVDADYKLKFEGKDKDVELGGVLWTEFSAPLLKK